MSGRVVFALTEQQAAALVAIDTGSPWPCHQGTRSRTILENTLFDRGLLEASSGGVRLTALGRAAAALAARLAGRSTG